MRMRRGGARWAAVTVAAACGAVSVMGGQWRADPRVCPEAKGLGRSIACTAHDGLEGRMCTLNCNSAGVHRVSADVEWGGGRQVIGKGKARRTVAAACLFAPWSGGWDGGLITVGGKKTMRIRE